MFRAVPVSRLMAAFLVASSALWTSTTAHAAAFDLSLAGFGVPTPTNNQPNERFRRLGNELAFAFAPRVSAPAESLGMSGFDLSLDAVVVQFATHRDYWRNNVTETEQKGRAPGSPQGVAGFHVRKGLPFSFELGAHVNWLFSSQMVAIGADVRWTPIEGYRYFPDFSIRGAASRLLGSKDFDLTTAEFDLQIGKTIPIAGMFQLSPYGGWGMLFVNLNSQVLDTTPGDVDDNDALARGGSLYTLADSSFGDNANHRFFVGLRFWSYIFNLTYQLDIGLISRTSFVMLTHTFKAGFEF